MRRSAVLVVAVVALGLAGCGSSPSAQPTASPQSPIVHHHPAGATPTSAITTTIADSSAASTASKPLPGPTLTASTNSGYGFKTTFTRWLPQAGDSTGIGSAVFAQCGVDASQAVAVQLQLHSVATVSQSEQIDLSFQFLASNPGIGAFVMDYGNGPMCVTQGTLATLDTTIGPSSSNSFTMWLIYENAISPAISIANDQVDLGQWLIQVASVTMQGQSVDNEDLYGYRVAACGEYPTLSYIFAAGAFPSTIGVGGSESCQLQMTTTT